MFYIQMDIWDKMYVLYFSYFIVSKKYTGSVGSEETHMNGDGDKYAFACNGCSARLFIHTKFL
jgi:hypothetical protein